MRILLDESTPQKLRLLINNSHVVFTTQFQGWSGLKNGTLLSAAETEGFDLFITADQEIEYQQNLTGRKLSILVLSTNNWSQIRTQFDAISKAIELTCPGCCVYLDIGHDRG